MEQEIIQMISSGDEQFISYQQTDWLFFLIVFRFQWIMYGHGLYVQVFQATFQSIHQIRTDANWIGCQLILSTGEDENGVLAYFFFK